VAFHSTVKSPALFGFVKFGMAGADVPLGIGALMVGLVMVMGGWFSFGSSKPEGTINVHNK
jgi:hypothetical protein